MALTLISRPLQIFADPYGPVQGLNILTDLWGPLRFFYSRVKFLLTRIYPQ